MSKHTAVTAEVALAAATAKTLLEITAPSTKTLEVSEWWVEFDGVSGSGEPVVVEILRKTATITGSSLTPRSKDEQSDALATAKHTAAAEGTDGDVLYRFNIHPQGGKHVMFPLGDEIIVQKSGMLAIKAIAPAVVNAIAGFGWRE
jgi:hypothetical protein